jgi:hypothetical protein
VRGTEEKTDTLRIAQLQQQTLSLTTMVSHEPEWAN